MTKRVTPEDIERINEIYLVVQSYAETARQVGFSATTVKKYIIKDYKPKEQKKIDLSQFKLNRPTALNLHLTEKEKKGIEALWQEMIM